MKSFGYGCLQIWWVSRSETHPTISIFNPGYARFDLAGFVFNLPGLVLKLT
jgi:hypothetical protein